MPVVIVAYDISDNYTRDKVAKLLFSMGFERVQRSLYAARGGSEKARQVAAAIARLIDPGSDRVDIIVVPEHYWRARMIVGGGEPPRERRPGGVALV